MKKYSIKVLKAALAGMPLALSAFSLPLVIQGDIQRTEDVVFGGERSYYEVEAEEYTGPSVPVEMTKSQVEHYVQFVSEEMKSRLNYKWPEDAVITAAGYSDGTMNIYGVSALDNRQYFNITLKNVNIHNGKAEIGKINVDWLESNFSPFTEQAVVAFRERLDMIIPANYTASYSLSVTEENTVEAALSWQDKGEMEQREEMARQFFEQYGEIIPDEFYKDHSYSEAYQALFTDVDLSAGTGVLTELRNVGDRHRHTDAEVRFTNKQKSFLLDAAGKFTQKNKLKADAFEGIADGMRLDINGSEILDIVYRNDDMTRTVISIAMDGKIQGYRNSIFYIGWSYLLTEEKKALFYDLAKTELKNKLNVSLPENMNFDRARLDPQMKSLSVSANNSQNGSIDEYSVSFNNINLEMGTGNVLSASAHVSDEPSVKELITPLEEMILGEFEKQFGITTPSSYATSNIYLSFNANEVNLNLNWTDRSSQSAISYGAWLTSVDLVNATGNFGQLGMQINYAHYTDKLQFTDTAIEKMTESARLFAAGMKQRTGVVTSATGFSYEGYSGLAITFAPVLPMEMQTTICVSENGRILSYQLTPTGGRTVPLSVIPK